MSHRSGHAAAPLLHRSDVRDRREPAVHRVVRGDFAVTRADVRVHRRHLAAIAAVVGDLHRHDHASVAIARELDVVRRTEAAIPHLHLPSFRVRRRAACLLPRTLLALFLLLLKFGEVLQSRLHASRAFVRRTLNRRFPTSVAGIVAAAFRIVSVLVTQLLHLLGRLTTTFLQRLLPTERTAPRVGANSHPILSHRFQSHNLLVQQRGDRVRQQFVQELPMIRAKIADQVIVHTDVPAEPLINHIAFTQPRQMPSTADPFNDREHPQRQQNLRIHRVPSDAPFDRPNLRVQRRQVERIHIRPHGSHPMILRHQLIQRRIPPLNLISLRLLHANSNHRTVRFGNDFLHHALIAPKFLGGRSLG